MLKLSANLSLLYTHLPWRARFDAARAAGFEAVEIQFPYQTPLAELVAASQTSGLPVVLINLPAADLMEGGAGLACHPARQGAFRQAFTTLLPYAEALGVEAVNILPGRLPAGVARETALEVLSANLHHAAALLAGHGIRATFEAINRHDMPGFLVSSGDDMLALLEDVAHANLYMQADLYHLARSGDNITAFLAKHWARIGHIQFADVPGRGAPGSGTLPFDDLFAQIAALPYRYWTGAEYRPGAPAEAWLERWRRRS
ncbi:hydroxypyruvate isomerase family protein [Gulbenkiania mobilis]|uniref:hydroxypyruvate isomerase family protein n=1 Tax=Gulbenkiania mobilis TaxID=397457 RepID=UPI000A5ABCDD|nr:TIM barrel protein [Gulbenkiania mobilis]